jgi:hypothetical protein
MKDAVNIGMSIMDTYFDKIDPKALKKDDNDDDDDDDANSDDDQLNTNADIVVYESKDPYVLHNLPYIIGSQMYMESDDVGLKDFESEDENEEEDDEEVKDEEESEEETDEQDESDNQSTSEDSESESEKDESKSNRPKQAIQNKPVSMLDDDDDDEDNDFFKTEKKNVILKFFHLLYIVKGLENSTFGLIFE